MEVAPLHNPFDTLKHNMFKNTKKFEEEKISKKQIYINLKQNEHCRAYAQAHIPARIIHQPSHLRRSGF